MANFQNDITLDTTGLNALSTAPEFPLGNGVNATGINPNSDAFSKLQSISAQLANAGVENVVGETGTAAGHSSARISLQGAGGAVIDQVTKSGTTEAAALDTAAAELESAYYTSTTKGAEIIGVNPGTEAHAAIEAALENMPDVDRVEVSSSSMNLGASTKHFSEVSFLSQGNQVDRVVGQGRNPAEALDSVVQKLSR